MDIAFHQWILLYSSHEILSDSAQNTMHRQNIGGEAGAVPCTALDQRKPTDPGRPAGEAELGRSGWDKAATGLGWRVNSVQEGGGFGSSGVH